jgi:hypothetical protein
MRTYVRDLRRPPRRTPSTRPRGRESDCRRAGRFEVAFVPLAQARALVELYAEHGDPKYERAALKYLARYLTEGDPTLADVAQMAALLAERSLAMRGPGDDLNAVPRLALRRQSSSD